RRLHARVRPDRSRSDVCEPGRPGPQPFDGEPLAMRRVLLTLTVLSLLPATALAARVAAGPAGKPAPKALLGTWQTTLTHADVEKLSPDETHRSWKLLIVNKPYLTYPQALGLQPAGVKGDTVPFAVQGHKLLLSCLDDNGMAIAGHGTYLWTIQGGSL